MHFWNLEWKFCLLETCDFIPEIEYICQKIFIVHQYENHLRSTFTTLISVFSKYHLYQRQNVLKNILDFAFTIKFILSYFISFKSNSNHFPEISGILSKLIIPNFT